MLKKFDFIAAEELTALLERRQNIVDWIQDFDRDLAGVDPSEPDARAALDKFRIFQEETIKKILEIDGLVIGLAQMQCSSIESTLSSLAKGQRLRDKFDGSGAIGLDRQHRLDGVL